MCIPWWGALSILPFWCDIQKNIWYVTFRAERFDAQVLIFKFLQSCRKLSERLSNGAKSREWAKLYSGCLRKYTTWERRGKRMPKTTGKTCYLTKGIKFSSNYMRSYKHKTRSRKRPSLADDHKTTKAAFIVKPESRYAGWLDPWASDSNAGQSSFINLVFLLSCTCGK